jgi:hypothetical protein
MTVEDAISSHYASTITPYAKPTFERFRRARHAAQYLDPSAPELSEGDAQWALATARRAVEGVQQLLASEPPPLFP